MLFAPRPCAAGQSWNHQLNLTRHEFAQDTRAEQLTVATKKILKKQKPSEGTRMVSSPVKDRPPSLLAATMVDGPQLFVAGAER